MGSNISLLIPITIQSLWLSGAPLVRFTSKSTLNRYRHYTSAFYYLNGITLFFIVSCDAYTGKLRSMNHEMERLDIDLKKYVICSKPTYQSIDGTVKDCMEFKDDKGVLYLAPKEDVLKLKEVPKNLIETYALRYGEPYSDGVVYTKYTVDLAYFERMKKIGIIEDFIVDGVGVRVFRGR